jgi:putative ABC transport system permease protein
MLRHYFKTVLRNLYRNKLYSSINILGLAIGIAATLLLSKYVGFNLTFDNSHLNKDRIFLVEQKEYKSGLQGSEQPNTYWGVAKMAVDLYPEVRMATHFTSNVEMLVMATTKDGQPISFNENRICTVDTSFFSIFSFSAIEGNVETAFSAPNAIVLTRSAAKKYFGKSDPIGQMMTTRVSWGTESTYKVTCVVPDAPINSTLQFDFLICAGTGPATDAYWSDPSYATYLLLGEAANAEELSAKMSRDIGENPIMRSEGKRVGFSLKRLSDSSLSPNDNMLAMIGVFILIISWMNFINLSIGSAQARSKETGVRKVIGATRKQVITQFVFECLLLNGFALLFAALMFALARPLLLEFSNNKVLPLFNDPTPVNWLFAVAFVVGAFASSAYPALVMSSLNPANSLKGKFTHSRYNLTFRKTLVVTQFTISIVAAIGVFIVSDQLDFFLRHDLKIKLDHIVAIKSPKDLSEGKMERLNSFKSEAMDLAMVENVATSTTTPGQDYRHEVNFGFPTSTDRHLFYLNDVDVNFFPIYGINFVAGGNYTIDTPAKNRRGIILNKTAVHALGIVNMEEAIGQKVMETENDNTYEIIGVVDDYHQLSLKYKIQPQAFRFNRNRGDISVKINAKNYASFEDLQDCISSLQRLWDKTYPDQSFEYQFLDSRFNDQYHDEFNFRKLFALFTGLSLIITCLGLFGLSLFISLKRKKEVGVRKVFGASSLTILMLFIKDYLKQMLISIVLGAPVAYFMMKAWLENFSFKTSINAESFLVPCLFLVIVSILTTAYQTVRASLANPTKTLKEE